MNDYSKDFDNFLGWEAISRDHIDVKAIYIDMAGGDHAAGIFLSQLIYWYLIPNKDGRSKLRVHREGHDWVAKSRDEWYEEIRLKPRQFDRVSKKLCDLGLIETKTFKFGKTPITHTRLLVDNFMKLWQELSRVDVSDLPRDVKSTSPDREVHIQRLPLEDKRSLVENANQEIDDDDKDNFCGKCGHTDYDAIVEESDPNGRCPWCFVLDGWNHHMNQGVRRSGTDLSKKLRKKARVRMENREFRRNWVFALEKASRMKYLNEVAWFTLEFFLRNDDSFRKVLGDNTGHKGMYDSFEMQNHPDNFAQLQAWLAKRAAGVADSVPQAGWAPIPG